MRTAVTKLHAAYLHARQPADARIALWSDDGLESLRTELPDSVLASATPVDAQLLLATEESTLRPLTAIPDSDNEMERSQARIAPALWTVPSLGVPLEVAVPWLASLDAAALPPAMRTR